jgi:hypothetical protein
MLRVTMYVVSYKLFWNLIGIVRFVFHEVCFDEGFVIGHFLPYFLQIVSLITKYLNSKHFQYQ